MQQSFKPISNLKQCKKLNKIAWYKHHSDNTDEDQHISEVSSSKAAKNFVSFAGMWLLVAFAPNHS